MHTDCRSKCSLDCSSEHRREVGSWHAVLYQLSMRRIWLYEKMLTLSLHIKKQDFPPYWSIIQAMRMWQNKKQIPHNLTEPETHNTIWCMMYVFQHFSTLYSSFAISFSTSFNMASKLDQNKFWWYSEISCCLERPGNSFVPRRFLQDDLIEQRGVPERLLSILTLRCWKWMNVFYLSVYWQSRKQCFTFIKLLKLKFFISHAVI